MAPELWRGEPADARSDLFACGILLSECLGADPPPRLLELAERLGAQDPGLRPPSARAALELLEPVEAPPAAPVERIAVAERRPPRWLPVAALCAVALVLGVVLANSFGGQEETPPPPEQQAAGAGQGGDAADRTDSGGGEARQDAGSGEPSASPPADGYALNDQGFNLIQEGAYAEAIPILEQAVAALEGSGDITYAYALYNLGNALRLAGRPAEAIPILEKRLEIDNQTAVVSRELELAREAAGDRAD